MKLIIAGGRNYRFTWDDVVALNHIHTRHVVTEVVSGKARGADRDGEKWAGANGIPVKPFPAQWNRFKGKSAAYHRNRDMARYDDALAVFPGGDGTAMMFELAKEWDLKIFDLRTPEGKDAI